MSDTCRICNYADRAEIENAILNLTADSPSNGVSSIEMIAEQYSVPLDELKMHALFHTPLISCEDLEIPAGTERPQKTSLTRKMKLKEADMLASVSREYLVTLKTMGRRINKLAQTSSIDIEDEDQQRKLAKLLTKPMVDLYIGLGGEIRQTVKTMAEVDRMLNGPEDSSSAGLVALANALNSSNG